MGLPLTASQTDATRAGFHVARSLSTLVLPAIHHPGRKPCAADLAYTERSDKLGGVAGFWLGRLGPHNLCVSCIARADISSTKANCSSHQDRRPPQRAR
jgi:hypothetical protein